LQQHQDQFSNTTARHLLVPDKTTSVTPQNGATPVAINAISRQGGLAVYLAFSWARTSINSWHQRRDGVVPGDDHLAVNVTQ
jgi:hypothetical protein